MMNGLIFRLGIAGRSGEWKGIFQPEPEIGSATISTDDAVIDDAVGTLIVWGWVRKLTSDGTTEIACKMGAKERGCKPGLE